MQNGCCFRLPDQQWSAAPEQRFLACGSLTPTLRGRGGLRCPCRESVKLEKISRVFTVKMEISFHAWMNEWNKEWNLQFLLLGLITWFYIIANSGLQHAHSAFQNYLNVTENVLNKRLCSQEESVSVNECLNWVKRIFSFICEFCNSRFQLSWKRFAHLIWKKKYW